MLPNLAYDTLRQSLTIPIFIAITALLTIHTTLRIFFAGSKPSQTVWAPSNARGPLAALHSAVHSTLDIRKTLRASSQRGGAFLVSTFLDGATVGLPVESMGWMAALPETTASMHAVQYRRLHLQYTLEPAEERDPRLVRMLMRLLGRFEEGVVPVLHEEIRAGFEREFGDGGGEGGWRMVCLHYEMLGVVARATNRYLVGKPLCRDDEYLGLLSSYTTSAVPIAMFLHLVPGFLLPMVGGLIRRVRNRLYQRKLLWKLVPLVRQQIESTRGKADGNSPTFLTRCIDEQTRHKEVLQDARVDPAAIAQVMIQLNFAGVHTVAAMATQTLYHILSYSQAEGLMSDLRRENAAVSRGADGDSVEKDPSSNRILTSSDLSKMPLLNSVVREALRISPMIATAMDLLVLKDVSTPSGLYLAEGTKVFIPGDAANQNPQIYADPATFNPYRFVERTESAADPSKVFVSFGFGVHACPGRLLAVCQMKLMLIHLLLNYDLQPLQAMPSGFCLGMLLIPSLSQKITLRARR